MGMLKEFRDFAVKGNVIDMAVGIVIGAAFGKIVTALVEKIVMPPIGMLLGKVDFSGLMLTLKEASADGPAVVVKYGEFLNTVVEFTIVAFCIFLVIKQINRLKREKPPADPTTKECPHCLATVPIKATKCGHCTSQL
jgi:large conductance mechanosensitive channel